MKSINSASLQSRRDLKLRSLILCVASIYLAMLCGFTRHAQNHNRSDESEIAPQSAQAPSSKLQCPVSAEVVLVSRIILQALPSHPDSSALATLIVKESTRANIDPLFVTAVMRAESMFKHGAVSQRGAQGLMQLMPQTGRYILKLENPITPTTPNLHDPITNVRLGIAYLKYLNQRFNGDRERALIAYNWGPTNLSNALRGNKAPPSQSLRYAQSIISHHQEWRSSLAKAASTSAQSVIG